MSQHEGPLSALEGLKRPLEGPKSLPGAVQSQEMGTKSQVDGPDLLPNANFSVAGA